MGIMLFCVGKAYKAMKECNVVVFSNNLDIKSLESMKEELTDVDILIFLTPQQLYDNERAYISEIFDTTKIEYHTYFEYISDNECELCDERAYTEEKAEAVSFFKLSNYYKNCCVIKNFKKIYSVKKGFVLSDDLGVNSQALIENGLTYKTLINYYVPAPSSFSKISNDVRQMVIPVYTADLYGERYALIGNMGRVKDSIALDFKISEDETERYNRGEYVKGYHYLTTVHDIGNCRLRRNDDYDIHMLVDGFIPDNYSGKDFKFKMYDYPLYATDMLQLDGLKGSYGIDAELFPAVKKQYLPHINKRVYVKQVLVALNCAGPWSSLISISDTDRLIVAVAMIAEKYPDICFILRPHPSADSPLHEGIHAVDRIAEYLAYKELPNLKMSLKVGKKYASRKFMSISENSLEEEIVDADLVISEYSHSLIEAAYRGKPCVSVNITGRRDYFQSVSRLGFPHCEGLGEFIGLFESISEEAFAESYNKAVDNYNKYIYGERI